MQMVVEVVVLFLFHIGSERLSVEGWFGLVTKGKDRSRERSVCNTEGK